MVTQYRYGYAIQIWLHMLYMATLYIWLYNTDMVAQHRYDYAVQIRLQHIDMISQCRYDSIYN